jgi:putrescine importer
VAIIVIGVLAFVPSGIVNFEKTAEILNSGALAAFMAVNLAAFWQFYVRGGEARRFWTDAAAPWGGLVSCLAIWLSLPRLALTIGVLWLAAGLALALVKVRKMNPESIASGFSTE